MTVALATSSQTFTRPTCDASTALQTPYAQRPHPVNQHHDHCHLENSTTSNTRSTTLPPRSIQHASSPLHLNTWYLEPSSAWRRNTASVASPTQHMVLSSPWLRSTTRTGGSSYQPLVVFAEVHRLSLPVSRNIPRKALLLSLLRPCRT